MGSSTVEYKLRVKRFTHAIDNDDVVLEEWCIFRRFTDFSALHKQLRSQVGEQAVGSLRTIREKSLNNFYQIKFAK